jgi:hypothetical protein
VPKPEVIAEKPKPEVIKPKLIQPPHHIEESKEVVIEVPKDEVKIPQRI